MTFSKAKVSSFLINLFATFAAFVYCLNSLKNPDLIHDPFFVAQAKAINEGLVLYKDIFSVYGPLTTWLLVPFIQFFGDYVVLARILQIACHVVIVVLCWNYMTKYITKTSAKTLLSLYSIMGSGMTESSSLRWPFNFGIWPTTLSVIQVVLVLNLIETFHRQKRVSSNDKPMTSVLSQSFLVGILSYSRLQGLLIFVGFLITLFLLKRARVLQREYLSKTLFSCLTGFLIPFSIILVTKSFREFNDQFIFANFRFARKHNNGSVVSKDWLSSLFYAFLFAALWILVVFVVLMALQRISIHLRVTLQIVIGTLSGYLIVQSGNYPLPSDLDRQAKLWLIKWISLIPNSFYWFMFLVFSSALLFALFKEVKAKTQTEQRFVYTETFHIMIIALLSLTLLYVNFAYLYFLVPILLLVIVKFQQSIDGLKFIMSKIPFNAFVVLFAFMAISISTLSFQLSQKSFSSRQLSFMSHRETYQVNLDDAITWLESQIAPKSSSMYFCDFSLFRLYDAESYLNDFTFYVSPPKSKEEYLRRLDDGVSRIIVCDSNAISELRKLNPQWGEIVFQIDEVQSLTVFTTT